MKKIVVFSAMAAIASLAAAQEQGRVLSTTPIVQQVAVPQQVCNNETVYSGNRTSGAVATVHNRSIKLVDAFVCEHGAATCVEAGIVFQNLHGGLNGIQCTTARSENGLARLQRCGEACTLRSVLLGRHLAALHTAGTAVDEKRPVLHGEGPTRKKKGGEGG